jgi:hypothetical protein
VFPERLIDDIDAAVPAGVTHVGFVATNKFGDFLITEPDGHPYGVSATFSKVRKKPDESPHETLSRCIRTQVGMEPISVYPVPVVWVTGCDNANLTRKRG